MTFTTLTFLLFLPIVFACHWALSSRRMQNLLLLSASYVFYGWWDWRFCGLMLASSLVDYVIGLRLMDTQEASRRKSLLAISLASNLGLLAVFKYFNFFAESFQTLATQLGWNPGISTLNLILPIGISFYTFQTLGYTIDVYRRRIPASHNLIDYLAFVSFFPQLVAGPIERAEKILPQFANKRTFDYSLASDGCRQILWGFAKKLVIADRLAAVVDPIYAQPELHPGPQLMLGTVFFAFQIYCDFSAYSDIAIGTAKLFGIRLMRNFAYPYFSQSVSEFWRRWHISLSTWFRDYVFIPLGGSRCSPMRRASNLMATFLVSGLWHGAAWRYVVWGGINGLATAAPNPLRNRPLRNRPLRNGPLRKERLLQGTLRNERLLQETGTQQDFERVPGGDSLIPTPATAFKMLCTFTIICAAWVFFRAESFGDAVIVLQRMGHDLFSFEAYQALATTMDQDRFLRKTATFLLLFVLWEWLQRRHECPIELKDWPTPLRWTTYTAMIWTTLYLMPQTGGREFIYFEF